MIFFDRSVPISVPRALSLVRDDIEWLDNLYPHNTPDVDWLRDCGQKDWLAITRDAKIRSRPAERGVIESNGVGAVILGSKRSLTRWEILRLVVGHLDEVVELHTRTPRPFIFILTASGLRQIQGALPSRHDLSCRRGQ